MQESMPFPRMAKYMMLFQFSPVMIWKTVTAAHNKVSKLFRGTCQHLEIIGVSTSINYVEHKVTYRSIPKPFECKWCRISFVVEAHRVAKELGTEGKVSTDICSLIMKFRGVCAYLDTNQGIDVDK